MSDMREMLSGLAENLFAGLAGEPFASAWGRLVEAGFAGLLVAEDRGGSGGDWGDLHAVLRSAGKHGLSAPLGETIIAHHLLASRAIALPEGAIAFGNVGSRVSYGRHVAAVLSSSDGELRLYDAAACSFEHGQSLDEAPRDLLQVQGPPSARVADNTDLLALGAFCRLAQSTGALEAAFALTIEHVNTRVQFGRPLAKFQAVQQSLAIASEHIAAVAVAGQAAAAALEAGDGGFEIAAAKLRTNQAIEVAVPILHRVHGAIGYTLEYPLNLHTRRLMSWRSEFGNDAYWARALGARVAKLGGAGLWPELTARSDRGPGEHPPMG